MFAIILENATYKELYLLRYYLSESKPQWFKQGRPRLNTNYREHYRGYYHGDRPNSSNQQISDFVPGASEQDISTYYGKPVTIVKQAPPYVKYEFENDTPQAINENYQQEYLSSSDEVTERPKYSGFVQAAVTTEAPVMTPTAVSLSKRPVLLPSNGNSKIFQQFEKPTSVGVTPTAMTVADTPTTEALIKTSPTTLVSATISVTITTSERHENKTSVNESTEMGVGSEGQSEFENDDLQQVEFDESQNEFESSGEIIFDQFDLNPNQIFSTNISGTGDNETTLVDDFGLNAQLVGEGSGKDEAVTFQPEEIDTTTSQTIPTTVFQVLDNDSQTKSSAAVLPSQRVNEVAYNSDNTTNSQLVEDKLNAEADQNTSDENNADEAETSTTTIATTVESNPTNTSELYNNQSSGNNSDIDVNVTDTTNKEEAKEVAVEDKDQLSSEILDYDSTVISCQDQRNSDSTKKEYFRPVLKCDNGSVIQIEYAYYGRFNSDTCARGKTESNQAWYWPTCGRKFKVRVFFWIY